MKRINRLFTCLLAALMLALPACSLAAPGASAVPLGVDSIPAVPAAPVPPRVERSQQLGDMLSFAFDRELPTEHLLTVVALDGDWRETAVRHALADDRCTVLTEALPSGGQWLRIELAWVLGGENATARYNVGGGLVHMTRFDDRYNEYVYDSEGVFMEYRSADTGVWTRFDPEGSAVRYSYEANGMRVWFDLAGNIAWATFEGDGYSCTWDKESGWVVEGPAGSVRVSLDLNPENVRPLVIVAEPSPTPKVVWYPNNTIALAGLSLQEASTSLPDKWYNVVPIDLTRQGRQTYFLTVSNARYIGECYVDVWGDEVTVTCQTLERSGIDLLSEYGRWFTSLSQITASSIESTADGFEFGRPVSISQELGGAQVALLFIRSKCTYRQPFRDGTELNRYWRNIPEWKTFRQGLQELMPYVAK